VVSRMMAALQRSLVVPNLRGRGFHSSTSHLNLSALYEIGSARRDSVARVKGVLGGV